MNDLINPNNSLILAIIDGFGIAPASNHNAISLAKVPFIDNALKNFPNCELEASGKIVGVPDGQMGNSEVGHMTISAGRTILQDLERINESIKSGNFETKLLPLIKNSNKNAKFHIIGMVSNGGVHGHIAHIIEIVRILNKNNIQSILHLITDGRDVAPKSAQTYIESIKTIAEIGTVCGRYYAMDRDNRWERTETAYNAIVLGEGKKYTDLTHEIDLSYKNGINDEFILPLVNESYLGMQDGDSVIFTNYRSDRIVQLSNAISLDNFSNFKRKKFAKLADKISMTKYSNDSNKYYNEIFKSQNLENSLGEIVSLNQKSQIRIAETEKYAHVTYFFNLGKEEKFTGEERVLIPSLKVATYDMNPSMSAEIIADKVIDAINSRKYGLIVCNFANLDMVGHTGNIKASILAAEEIDKCLTKIAEIVVKNNASFIITADHGNAEEMIDIQSGDPKTAHSCNKVPFIIYKKELDKSGKKLKNGSLRDIAPTLLTMMGISIPKEMTGSVLFNK